MILSSILLHSSFVNLRVGSGLEDSIGATCTDVDGSLT